MYASELEQQGINIVGIAQFRTSESDTANFIAEHGLTFTNIYDSEGKLATAYGVEGVPAYVFLDAQGRVAERSSGARGTDYLKGILSMLSEEEEPPEGDRTG